MAKEDHAGSKFKLAQASFEESWFGFELGACNLFLMGLSAFAFHFCIDIVFNKASFHFKALISIIYMQDLHGRYFLNVGVGHRNVNCRKDRC